MRPNNLTSLFLVLIILVSLYQIPVFADKVYTDVTVKERISVPACSPTQQTPKLLHEQQDKDGNNYQEVTKIPTDNGARTSLFAPQLDRLYVAAPDYSGKGAEIQIFETHKIQ